MSTDSTPTASTATDAALADLLVGWLPGQRWFAGKGRELQRLTIAARTCLVGGDPDLEHLLLQAEYADGHREHYQLLLGLSASPAERVEHAVIGVLSGRAVYDAVHDQDLTHALLTRFAEGTAYDGLQFATVPGTELDTTLSSRVLGAEQTNTSLVYGDHYICKFFRRVAPGRNPDLELTLALAEVGSEHIAAPLGWLSGQLEGEETTLALLQAFLQYGSDGWATATASVRDLFAEADLHADEVGGDFASESERLGAATAAVHADLARALGTSTATTADLQALSAGMLDRLDEAAAAVPALEAHLPALRNAFAAVADHDRPVTLQRIHGDYHLGQVMRSRARWVLLDFEGEPARPLSERRAPGSLLRDVAGMLRSYDYAAQYLLADHPGEPGLAYRASEWAERNRTAFCDGYTAASGSDPREEGILLRAFEMDKAVYEVLYETRHRPTWVAIPLGSLQRLIASPA